MPKKKAKFTIPYNGDLALVEEALATGSVHEVYFAGPKKGNNSHYAFEFESACNTTQELSRLVKLCGKYGAKSNLLCNGATMFFTNFRELLSGIRSVGNVDSVTVAEPQAIAPLKAEFPKMNIQASVIMHLDSLSRVEQALKLGAGTINVPMKLNRNMPLLRSLLPLKKRYPDFKLKLIANHECAYDCMYSPSCYMRASLKYQVADAGRRLLESEVYLAHDDCHIDCHNAASLMQIPFIRPEDIAYYEKNLGEVFFKLVYRQTSSETLRKIYASYFAEKHKGNLFEIIAPVLARSSAFRGKEVSCDNEGFPPDFVKKVTTCDKECGRCPTCGQTGRTVLDIRPSRRRLTADPETIVFFSALLGLTGAGAAGAWWIKWVEGYEGKRIDLELGARLHKIAVSIAPEEGNEKALKASCTGTVSDSVLRKFQLRFSRRLKKTTLPDLLAKLS